MKYPPRFKVEGPREPELERIDKLVRGATRRLVARYCARQERRARVALMFFRPDQLTWAYHPGEAEPRIEVNL